MRATGSSVALALLAVMGCESPSAPKICTAIAMVGLTVTVQDSVTGAPLTPTRIIVSARAYADTVFGAERAAGEGATYALVGERPGVYSVTVERAGYRHWRQDGVRVSSDGCHVRPVNVVARLQPRL